MYIPIDDAKIGDVIALPIVTSDAVVLLGEGTVLSMPYIDKIKASKIKKIYIHDNISNVEKKSKQGYIEVKNMGIDTVSSIYKKVINFESVQLEEIYSVVNNIVDLVKKDNNIPAGLMKKMQLKDNFTFLHSINTCYLSIFLGEYMKLSDENLIKLGVGALLHDIGKIRIDESILKKNTRLTSDEYEEIKKHTNYGYEILSGINNIYSETPYIALNHHEKFDGSGYPRGMKGANIDIYSQIVSVCDVYDALICARSYKPALKPNETFEYILSKSGTFFNISVVTAFRECMLIYPDGVGVKLSNGRLGFVYKQNLGYPERPIIHVVTDSYGYFIDPIELDLLTTLNVVIDDIII